jgi:hypothetical protein
MEQPNVTDEDTLEHSSEAVKEIETWMRKNSIKAEDLGIVGGPQINRETGHWWVHIQVQHKDTGNSLRLDLTYAKRNLSQKQVAQEYARLRSDIRHLFHGADLRFAKFNEYYESVVDAIQACEE